MDNKERSAFIKSLVEIFNKNSLNSLEFKDGDLELKLKKEAEANLAANPNVVATLPTLNTAVATPLATAALAPVAAKTEHQAADYSNHPGAVKSPTVGVIYLSPTPDKPPFIRKGATVKKDDTLFLLEVMKVFNPIKAPKDGVVKEILVKDTSIVEYNEVLAIIE